MKRIITIVLSLILLATAAYSQPDDQQLQDKRRIVFWIKLNIKITKDPTIKAYRYTVSVSSKRIFSGSLELFQQQLWQARSSGKYLLVGPFTNREQAQLAIEVFSPNAERNAKLLNDPNTYYWYLVKLEYYRRLHAYKFVHIPAAVAEGKLKDFIAVQKAAAFQQAVVIGPFSSRLEAEWSKRIYRQEE